MAAGSNYDPSKIKTTFLMAFPDAHLEDRNKPARSLQARGPQQDKEQGDKAKFHRRPRRFGAFHADDEFQEVESPAEEEIDEDEGTYFQDAEEEIDELPENEYDEEDAWETFLAGAYA